MKICVYAICKNESKFVNQWLDNMSEADYIVVLDTGSTDGTYERLKADPRVTRVEQQKIKPWRFDVARNESMKLVPEDSDVLVCTDFDEKFVPGWAQVIRTGWKPNTTQMNYTYAWSHSEVGEPTDVFKYDKIHNKNFHWVFPVHEVLMPNKEIEDDQHIVDAGEKIYLHHYQDKSKERGSYFDLLKLSVKEFPDDSHVRMLLAREYLLREQYEEALEEYLYVLKMPDINASNKRLVLLESLGRAADLYRVLGNYDETIWYCQEFIKEDYTYREPYLMLGQVYNEMGMPTLAEATVLQGLKSCTRKYNWVERADAWTYLPEDLLSITYYKLNDYDKALDYCKEALKHNPDDPRMLKNYSVYMELKLKQIENKLKELEDKN